MNYSSFAAEFAKKNNISFKKALTDARESYYEQKKTSPPTEKTTRKRQPKPTIAQGEPSMNTVTFGLKKLSNNT